MIPLSFPTGLSFIPGATASPGGRCLFEPDDCEDGGGKRIAQRIAAPLDAWMLKCNFLFMNLFTVVPVVKENVSFFFFPSFLFFLALP